MAGRRRNRGQWVAPVIISGGAIGFIIALASGGELLAIGSALLAAALTAGMLIAWWSQRFLERAEGNTHPEPVPIRTGRASYLTMDERSEQ